MEIKIVHLLLEDQHIDSFSNKQKISIEYFSKVSKYFYKYCQVFNKRPDFAPIETCNTPDIWVESPDKKPHSGPWVSTGHYGAFNAHRDALLNEFSHDLDAILIVEGDVVSDLSPENFTEAVSDAISFGKKNSASFITFAATEFGQGSDAHLHITPCGNYDKIKHFICCNCYLVFSRERENIQSKLKDAKWMAFDIWLYWNYDNRVPMFRLNKPIARETPGFSFIDFKEK
jgi:hypothetical protein